MIRRPPRSTLFPYTSSSDLLYRFDPPCLSFGRHEPARSRYDRAAIARLGIDVVRRPTGGRAVDRKSTRLNSSHLVISYAVFCLKKKRLGRLAEESSIIIYDH